jgi:hypothetical protein
MSHFARVLNGYVTTVIVAEQDFIDQLPDKSLWIQTSYNTRHNIHYTTTTYEQMVTTPEGISTVMVTEKIPSGKPGLRGNYADVGFIYDQENDVFYEPSPYPSWVINTSTWDWQAPVEPLYNDEFIKIWSENQQRWIQPLSTVTDFYSWAPLTIQYYDTLAPNDLNLLNSLIATFASSTSSYATEVLTKLKTYPDENVVSYINNIVNNVVNQSTAVSYVLVGCPIVSSFWDEITAVDVA